MKTGTKHHFTDYSMIPNPLPFLAYMVGRTSRVDLGSMVVVLPWHNPARLAGEIGVVDNLTDGSLRLGIGRGLGKDDAAQFCSDLHVKGAPAQCLEKLEWIKNATGAEALLGFFSYSGIPFEESRRGLFLYSEEVLPIVGAWA